MTPSNTVIEAPVDSWSLPATSALKHGGLIDKELRKIEFNTQNVFTRYQDNLGRIYWVYFPHKHTNLTARVYPNLASQAIEIGVYEQDCGCPADTTKGTRISNWTAELAMNGPWKRDLADLAGRAQKQAEIPPKCRCRSLLALQTQPTAPYQFFRCSQFPKCRWTATIKEYGYLFNNLGKLRRVSHNRLCLKSRVWE